MIAAYWLVAGYDTEPLRQLAGPGVGDGYQIRRLLSRVLESLGLESGQPRHKTA